MEHSQHSIWDLSFSMLPSQFFPWFRFEHGSTSNRKHLCCIGNKRNVRLQALECCQRGVLSVCQMISGKGPACAPCRSIRYTRNREDVRATVLAVVTRASAVVEDTGPGRCVPDMRVHCFFLDLDCFVYFPSFPERKCRRQNACSWIHAAVVHLALVIH